MSKEFKATLPTKTLLDLSEFVAASTYELEIKIIDGIKIQYTCISGFSGAEIILEKNRIKNLQGQATFIIDTIQFNALIKTFTDENITLELIDSRLYLSTETQECYLNLISSIDSADFIKIRPLPTYLKINSKELHSFIKDATKFGKFILFRFNGDKKELSASTENPNLGFKKEFEVISSKGQDGTATFQLEFLKELLTNAEGELEIEIGNQQPIKFKFKIGDLQINSFVAPRVEGY